MFFFGSFFFRQPHPSGRILPEGFALLRSSPTKREHLFGAPCRGLGKKLGWTTAHFGIDPISAYQQSGGMSGATWWWNPSKHLQVGKYFGDPLYLKWLVVWNIFYFSIYWECHHPNWLIFFRGVGIPPTSKVQFTSFKSYLQFAEIIRRKVHQGLTWAWTDPRDPFGLERCQATWRIAFLQTWNMVMVCFI